VGGRYWDRTSDPCRVNVFRAALAALVTHESPKTY
jgi:hypothetical protein